jgi:hypothetical protein
LARLVFRFSAFVFYKYVGVPDGMEFGVAATEENFDIVSALGFGFCVERLVDIADEVEKEF